jgi:uncharacterized protein YidB (DUF937 family)
MLDEILDLVKEQALGAVTDAGVPADKRNAAVETTAASIVEGLKDTVSLDTIPSLIGLLGGGSHAVAASNPVVSSIQNTVVSALSEKVGLNKTMATTIATTVVPALISLLSQKSNDPDDSFDFGSLIRSFTGGDSGGGFLGGILGKFLK